MQKKLRRLYRELFYNPVIKNNELEKLYHQIHPRLLYRYTRVFLVAQNQRQIINVTKTTKCLFLTPKSPSKKVGSVQHYYHFLFDLVLPLHLLMQKAAPDVVFALKPIGVLTERLHEIFPERIEIIKPDEHIGERVSMPIVGMNPQLVYVRPKELESLKQYICRLFAVDPPKQRNKVLLIERLPPDDFFLTQANKKGGGALRRSIPNHAEFASKLQAMIAPPYELHNLQLETVPFSEQIKYFNEACMVVGQHGAGLGNCIWMEPNSTVVEICHAEFLNMFRIISHIKRHRHFVYKTPHAHAEIDVDQFMAWLKQLEPVASVFSDINNQESISKH